MTEKMNEIEAMKIVHARDIKELERKIFQLEFQNKLQNNQQGR